MNWPTFTPIEWTSAGAMAAYLGLLSWKARAAFAYLREEREGLGGEKSRDELTVLQPIVSGDPTLETCLRASAELAQPGTQFVWLLDQGDSEARRIADDLDRPGITIQEVPAAPPGVNPKVDKLSRALEGVTTEFIAVLDDDTTVGRRHLDRALQILGSHQGAGGLYTGLPTYRAVPGNSAANLMVAFVNSSSALTYLPPAHAGPPVTLNGMFYVTRAADLREVGGFATIADQLCDDLALARLYRSAGRPIHQGGMAQLLLTGPFGLGAYFQRMHRWFVFALVLMRGLEPPQRLRLAWTLGAPPILLWWSLAGVFIDRRLTIPFAALLVARLWTLAALLEATREAHGTEAARCTDGAEIFPISSIVSELLQPLHFVHALIVPRIRWRSHRMRVQKDGGFESLPR
ncbi:hypothetical protein Poly30_14570 [Planctomycetes bacterium Poly30]|uniref:N-glycosyltransferase n=2 Tax=Saltatorellus ferox TaxID=2528018 RepID=A0A518EPE0_9BACT|nr:hypothetical protein Poly30_14570 [Planctomycetes bacterium Poly30]